MIWCGGSSSVQFSSVQQFIRTQVVPKNTIQIHTYKHKKIKSTSPTIALTLNSLRPSDALICVSKLIIICSDNGLSPGRRQAIIWTNAGILLIGPLGTNFSDILIEIHAFSFKKMHLKMSSGKRRPFCLRLCFKCRTKSFQTKGVQWHNPNAPHTILQLIIAQQKQEIQPVYIYA